MRVNNLKVSAWLLMLTAILLNRNRLARKRTLNKEKNDKNPNLTNLHLKEVKKNKKTVRVYDYKKKLYKNS